MLSAPHPDGALLRQLQLEGVADLTIVAWKFGALALIQIGFVRYKRL